MKNSKKAEKNAELLSTHFGTKVSPKEAANFIKQMVELVKTDGAGYKAPVAAPAPKAEVKAEAPKAKKAKKKKAWKTPEERNAFLAKARDKYFMENGIGPYKPKAQIEAEGKAAEAHAEKAIAKAVAKVKKDAAPATAIPTSEAEVLLKQLGSLLGFDVKKRA